MKDLKCGEMPVISWVSYLSFVWIMIIMLLQVYGR